VAQERNSWLACLVSCLGSFVVVLDLTIVTMAIPTMLVRLRASLDQIVWVVHAYLLTFAVQLVLPFSWPQ
jgi:MFS family permease